MRNIINTGFIVASLLLAESALAVCNANVPLSKPDVIYTDNNNATVNDEKTGLVWQKCPIGLSGNQCQTGAINIYSWDQAHIQADEHNTNVFAGFNDWRLPSVAELRTLVEDACTQPSINTNFFPGFLGQNFWTSSPYVYPSGGIYAWYISFVDGREVFESKANIYAVRLVRGGN